MPLGSTALVRPTAMVNILGEDSVPNEALSIPSLTIHWYDKEKRAGRKMGHLNLCGKDELELAQRLAKLASILDKDAFPELADFADRYLATLN